mgnify:CR=1 FL=1
MGEMSDHQDSEHFAYDKNWEDIEKMLEQAERQQNFVWMRAGKAPRGERMYWLRQYKGLEGVINALRWVLGDKNMTREQVLGKDKP